ncbi:aminotransferase class I/II-fold pyridoxal phosphate-dependent enzyme [Deinococcus peraridilitoris]|nr:aminotransferase class I/II-fold pyridoxal phosphate-dependent enzyme [Deinococcus peraridilitoris]
MKAIAARVAALGPSPFAEMTALAQRYGAVNLGQGFPDFGPPAFLQDALLHAAMSSAHQYSPPPGLPTLREAVAEMLAPTLGFVADPEQEVTITVGATEGLAAALLALIEPGDEVVLIEPAYDSYAPQVRMAGGTPRSVSLQRSAAGWDLPLAALQEAGNGRTKAIVLNTPHNPTGKVFSSGELAAVAAFARQWDAYVLSDEVYDRLTFERPHVSIASLPDMRERTVTLGSVGKTFAATGWRIGWAVASPELTAALRGAHTFGPFCAPTPLQAAVAQGLRTAREQGYEDTMRAEYRVKRDLLTAALRAVGFEVLPCDGTFFLLADWSPFAEQAGTHDDREFCRWLVREVGVAAIAPSIFFSAPHRAQGAHLARFVFCKTLSGLEEAAARLDRLR